MELALVRFKQPALVGTTNHLAGDESYIPSDRAYELVEMAIAEPVDDQARRAIREGSKHWYNNSRVAPVPYQPRPPVQDEASHPEAVEVVVSEHLLVDKRNLIPGERVRVSPDRATVLIEKGYAVIANKLDRVGAGRIQEARRRRESDSNLS